MLPKLFTSILFLLANLVAVQAAQWSLKFYSDLQGTEKIYENRGNAGKKTTNIPRPYAEYVKFNSGNGAFKLTVMGADGGGRGKSYSADANTVIGFKGKSFKITEVGKKQPDTGHGQSRGMGGAFGVGGSSRGQRRRVRI